MSRCEDLYIVHCGTPGHPIKIGASGQVTVRIRSLRCPECQAKPLTIILHAPGAGGWYEKLLLGIYQPLQIQGEWFEDSPRIRLFAEHLRALNPEDVIPTITTAHGILGPPRYVNQATKLALVTAAA